MGWLGPRECKLGSIRWLRPCDSRVVFRFLWCPNKENRAETLSILSAEAADLRDSRGRHFAKKIEESLQERKPRPMEEQA